MRLTKGQIFRTMEPCRRAVFLFGAAERKQYLPQSGDRSAGGMA